MSIEINVVDPCSKNFAKFLHGIADYIGTTNQKIEVNIDITLKSDKGKR